MGMYFKVFLVFVISFILIGGVFAAETEMDSYYTDSNGQKINNAKVGDTVQFYVEVFNGDTNSKEKVVLDMEVKSPLLYDDWRYYVTWDGGQTWKENDPTVSFKSNKIRWNIGTIISGQLVAFNWIGVPLAKGREDVHSTVSAVNVPVNQTSAYLEVVSQGSSSTANEVKASVDYVPMQETGVLMDFLTVAIALIGTGLIFPSIK
ncbi:MAG: NPXTG-anchored protein [Methanobacteriaceae archaeon]